MDFASDQHVPRKRPPSKTALTPAPAAHSPAVSPIDPERIEQVMLWMLEGQRDADIVLSIQSHWPDQDADALLVEISGQLAKQARSVIEAPEAMHGFLIQATLQCYQKMFASGDFVGALRALKDLRELSRCS